MFQIAKTLMWAMLMWFAYAYLAQLFWVLPYVVTFLAIINVIVIWMLREHPRQLAIACRRSIIRRYVECICYVTREPMPTEQSKDRSVRMLQLHTQKQFDQGGRLVKQRVFGHDSVIDRMLTRIYENLTLQKKQRRGPQQGPLASYLLIGNEGIGKCYLTRVVSKAVYNNSTVDIFDCQKITPTSLAKTLQTLAHVERHGMILLEHIDMASAELSESIARILTTGRLRSPDSTEEILLHDRILVLTTTQAVAAVELLDDEALGEAAWQHRAVETLETEASIDQGVLKAVAECGFCRQPTESVQGKVVAELMLRECAKSNVKLTWVDPEIVATQVLQIHERFGFRHMPQLVRKLFHRPLVAAIEGGHHELVLRLRHRSGVSANR